MMNMAEPIPLAFSSARSSHPSSASLNNRSQGDVAVVVLEPQNNTSDRREVVLREHHPIVIGRVSKSSVKHGSQTPQNALFDCPVISREHARLELRAGSVSADRVCITDQHSMHGTRINGVRIPSGQKIVLRHGDTIQLGSKVDRGAVAHLPLTLNCRLLSQTTQHSLVSVTDLPSARRGFQVPGPSDDESSYDGYDSDHKMQTSSDVEEPGAGSSAQTTPEKLRKVPGSQDQPIDIDIKKPVVIDLSDNENDAIDDEDDDSVVFFDEQLKRLDPAHTSHSKPGPVGKQPAQALVVPDSMVDNLEENDSSTHGATHRSQDTTSHDAIPDSVMDRDFRLAEDESSNNLPDDYDYQPSLAPADNELNDYDDYDYASSSDSDELFESSDYGEPQTSDQPDAVRKEPIRQASDSFGPGEHTECFQAVPPTFTSPALYKASAVPAGVPIPGGPVSFTRPIVPNRPLYDPVRGYPAVGSSARPDHSHPWHGGAPYNPFARFDYRPSGYYPETLPGVPFSNFPASVAHSSAPMPFQHAPMGMNIPTGNPWANFGPVQTSPPIASVAIPVAHHQPMPMKRDADVSADGRQSAPGTSADGTKAATKDKISIGDIVNGDVATSAHAPTYTVAAETCSRSSTKRKADSLDDEAQIHYGEASNERRCQSPIRRVNEQEEGFLKYTSPEPDVHVLEDEGLWREYAETMATPDELAKTLNALSENTMQSALPERPMKKAKTDKAARLSSQSARARRSAAAPRPSFARRFFTNAGYLALGVVGTHLFYESPLYEKLISWLG